MKTTKSRLDKMLTRFLETDSINRYAFIKHFKTYLNLNPMLREDYHHPLYQAMIEHHLQHLRQELNQLEPMLLQRSSQYEESLNALPEHTLSGYVSFSAALEQRVTELKAEIREYSADLSARSAHSA